MNLNQALSSQTSSSTLLLQVKLHSWDYFSTPESGKKPHSFPTVGLWEENRCGGKHILGSPE